jgi:hypothetical protein
MLPCGLVRIFDSTASTTGAGASDAGASDAVFTLGEVDFDLRKLWFGKGRMSIRSVSPFFFLTLVLVNRVASRLLQSVGAGFWKTYSQHPFY